MDFRELTKLLFKISGAWILIQTVTSLPGYFASSVQLLNQSFTLFFTVTLLPFLIPVLIGLFLLFFPGAVANRLVASNSTQNLPDVNQIERVLLSILGLYLLYRAVSDAIFLLVKFFSYRVTLHQQMANAPLPANFLLEMYGSLIGTGFEFVLALCLMLGAKRIQSMLAKLRG